MASYRTADATVAAWDGVNVSANDTNVFPVTRSLYIGTSGDLKVRHASGRIATYPNAYVGYHPLQVDMILTDSTAGDFVALY